MSEKRFRITLDNSAFLQSLRETQAEFARLQESISKSTGKPIEDATGKIKKAKKSGKDMNDVFAQTGKILAGAFATAKLGDFIASVAQVRGQFQQLEIAFNTMLGSKAKADALMAQIVDTAARTPFDLQGVAMGAKQLLAYGTASEEVNQKLLMLGDIAAGVSAPLGDLVYLYGTTMVQGRMFTQDLRQFQGRGIPIAEELAKQFGVAKDKVGELVTAGKVGAKEFNAAMESLAKGKFNNLMAEQSKSITGQMSNLQDQIQGVFNEIGKASEGTISKAISSASFLLEHYKEFGKVLVTLIALYGTYRTALMVSAVTHQVLGGATLTGVAALRVKIAVLQRATMMQIKHNLAVMANPYVLATMALVALAGALWMYASRASAAEQAQQDFNKTLEDQNAKIDDNRSKAEALLNTIRDGNETNYARNKAYEGLIAIYPDLLGKIDLEKLKTMELSEALRELNELRDAETIGGKKSNVANARKALRDWDTQYDGESVSNSDLEERRKLVESLRLAEADLAKEENRQAEAKLTNEQKLARATAERQKSEAKIAEYRKKQEEASKRKGKPISAFGDLLDEQYYQGQIKAEEARREAYIKEEEKYRSTVADQTRRTKEVIKKERDALSDEWDNLTEPEKKSSKGKDLANRISKLDSELKRHELPDSAKTSKEAQQAREQAKARAEALEEIGREEARSERQRIIERMEASVATMQDGYDKELATIELNAKRRSAKLEELHEAMMAENARRDKAEWLAKDPKRKEIDYVRPASLSLTDAQSKHYEAQAKIDAQAEYQERAQIAERLFEKYKTFEQKRADVVKYYAEERKRISEIEGKTEEEKANAIAEANKQERKEISEINSAIAEDSRKSSDIIVNLFSDASERSAREIRKIITTTRELVEYLMNTQSEDIQAGFGMSADTLRAWQSDPEKMKSLMDGLASKMRELGDLDPFGKMVLGIKDSIRKIREANDAIAKAKATIKSDGVTDDAKARAQDNINDAMAKRGEAIAHIGKSVSDVVPKMRAFGADMRAIFGDEMGDQISDLSDTIESLGGVASGVGQIMSGNIIGGAMGIISSVSSLIAKGKKIAEENARVEREAHEARIRYQEEYNLLLMRQNLLYREGVGILGEDKYGKAINAIKVQHKAIEDLSKKIKGTKEDQSAMIPNLFGFGSSPKFREYFLGKLRGTKAFENAGLGRIQIADGTYKDSGFLGTGLWSRTRDQYKSILNVYPQLIDAQGKFNLEQAKTILATRKFAGGGKEALEIFIKLAEQAEEAKKATTDYLSGIFGSFGSQLSDSLVNAFKRGESAASAFRTSVGAMFEQLAKDMAYNAILANPIQQASEAMEKLYNDPTLNSDSRMIQTANILGSLLDNMDMLSTEYYKVLEQAESIGKRRNFDTLRNSADTRSASSKGIAQASQDSIDTLIGLGYAEVAILERIAVSSETLTPETMRDAIRGAIALDKLMGIQERCLQELVAIRTNTAVIASASKDIQTNGITLRR